MFETRVSLNSQAYHFIIAVRAAGRISHDGRGTQIVPYQPDDLQSFSCRPVVSERSPIRDANDPEILGDRNIAQYLVK